MSTETLWIGGALFVVDYDDDGVPSIRARTVLGAGAGDFDDEDACQFWQ